VKSHHDWLLHSLRESQEFTVRSLNASPKKAVFVLKVNDVRFLTIDIGDQLTKVLLYADP
jgi:hypothetical protein